MGTWVWAALLLLGGARVSAVDGRISGGTGALLIRVFHDTNENDRFDESSDAGGETGIADAIVDIRDADTRSIVATLKTIGTGVAFQPGLPVGEYVVALRSITGFFTPKPTVSVSVEPGVTFHLGLAVLQRGTVSGVVFADDDSDGVRDEGEVGIPGVAVTIEADGFLPFTGVTAANGGFSVTGIAPGLVRLAVGLPSDRRPSTPTNVVIQLPDSGATEVAFGAKPLRLDPPVIATQPVSGTWPEGSPATLAVIATGTEPLSYQWFKDGGRLPEATNRVLEIPVLRLAEAGDYRVEVTNVAGVVLSEPAVVTVQPEDPYLRWAVELGLTAEVRDPGLDLDGDGLANLFEYYLGTDPRQAAVVPPIRFELVARGTLTRPALVFSHAHRAGNVAVALEGSEDLRQWRELSTSLEIVRSGDAVDTVQCVDPEPVIRPAQRFFRLKLSLVP